MTRETFEHLTTRIDPAPFAATYKAADMDREIAAIRAEFARTGMTDAGSMLVSIIK